MRFIEIVNWLKSSNFFRSLFLIIILIRVTVVLPIIRWKFPFSLALSVTFFVIFVYVVFIQSNRFNEEESIESSVLTRLCLYCLPFQQMAMNTWKVNIISYTYCPALKLAINLLFTLRSLLLFFTLFFYPTIYLERERSNISFTFDDHGRIISMIDN